MSEPSGTGPLAGYRVLELGSTAAGPFCGRIMGDFGADVVKVEPREGDIIRSAQSFHQGRSLYATTIMRNKRLVSIDLRTERGREIVRTLVAASDVVIENFRPGTMERWGLGYDDLCAVRPDIVMVRVSGYGQDGPYGDRPGFGVICEAAGGLRHLIGDPDRPPARVAMALTDYLTGLYASLGAVMALLHRSRTGRGQYIDAALSEAALSFIDIHIPAYEKLGVIANRAGAGLAGSVPNSLYPTRDGRFVLLNAAQQTVFRRFAPAIGMPELLEDERFATMVARGRHPREMDDIVAQWTSSLDMKEVLAVLETAAVPATAVNTVADIFEDPQVRARRMLVKVPHDAMGSVTLVAPVPRLSLTPGTIRWAGGDIGQDTRAVLREIAGLTESEIRALQDEGVVFCAA